MSNNQNQSNGDSGCLVIIAILILLAVWSIADKMPQKPKTEPAAANKAEK